MPPREQGNVRLYPLRSKAAPSDLAGSNGSLRRRSFLALGAALTGGLAFGGKSKAADPAQESPLQTLPGRNRCRAMRRLPRNFWRRPLPQTGRRRGSLRDECPEPKVGNYWPFAPTLWDYIIGRADARTAHCQRTTFML
jgi:hypothetical protein